MSEIEDRAGLLLAGLIIFIFLLLVAFIKRNKRSKTDTAEADVARQSREYKQ